MGKPIVINQVPAAPPRLKVLIMEQVYNYSPRVPDKSYRDHIRAAMPHVHLNRESVVVKKIRRAWWETDPRNGPSVVTLATACSTGDCEQRAWLAEPNEAMEQAHVYVQEIRQKWLYVLVGRWDLKWMIEAEIYCFNADKWFINPNPEIGPRSKRNFTGKEIRGGDDHYEVDSGRRYQFFLSPIQLSEGAMKKLMAVAKQLPKLRPPGAVHSYADGAAEQLFSTTLRRRFKSPTKPGTKSRVEVVPVLDPFSWAQEVNELDFRTILEAHLEFLTNPNEMAKLQMATILTALIGARGEDELDLMDEMREGASALKQRDKAAAWLDRYKKCNKFLGEESKKACLRLIEWLDSEAHMIVELASQEEQDTPGRFYPLDSSLTMGLTHYMAVLRDIMGSQVGEAFIAKLFSQAKDRIPYKFILYPGKKEQDELQALRQKIGDLALQIFVLFLPMVIAKHRGDAGTKAVEHVQNLGVKAEVPQGASNSGIYFERFRFFTKTLLALSEKNIARLGEFLPKYLGENVFSRVLLASKIDEFVGGAYALWTGYQIYGEDEGAAESARAKATRIKGKVEYPFKVGSFVAQRGREYFAYRAEKRFGIDLEAWLDSPHPKRVSREIRTFVDNGGIESFQKMTKVQNIFRKSVNILDGPVALVFGGIDLVLQARDMLDAWEEGNFGGAVGMGVQYASAVVSVSATIVASTNLIGMGFGVGYATLFGTLAAVAMGLMLVGIFLVWVFSKSDLELFALHCVFGDRYDVELVDPILREVVVTTKYSDWSKGEDRFEKQLRHLIYLISEFKVTVLSSHLDNPASLVPRLKYGAFIKTGYLPPGSIAEVVIIGKYLNKYGVPAELTSTALINMDTGDYVISGEELKYHDISAEPSGSWGTEKFKHFKVELPHMLTDGMMTNPITNTNRAKDKWTVKVRIDVGGNGKLYIPKSEYGEKYLEMESYQSGFVTEYSKTSSEA